jgi:hypothetical protein
MTDATSISNLNFYSLDNVSYTRIATKAGVRALQTAVLDILYPLNSATNQRELVSALWNIPSF